MNKKLFSLICLSCTFSCVLFAVHELRTPLTLQSKLHLRNGSFHYPIWPIDEEKTNVDVWAGAYYRSACCGYCPKACDWSCSSVGNNCAASACNTSFLCPSNTNFVGCTSCCGKKVPLAQLFFGKSAFYGREVFSPETDFTNHPELTNLVMRPVLDYRERGVVIGMHMEKKVRCSKWRVGFNVSLPVKNIGVTRHVECEPDITDVTFDLKAKVDPEDPLLDRFYEKYEKLRSPRQQDVPTMGLSFMYRLDFLSQLQYENESGTMEPLVQYSNGSVKIAGREVAANPASFTTDLIASNTIPVMAYKLENKSSHIIPAREEIKNLPGSLAVSIFYAAQNGIPYDGGVVQTKEVLEGEISNDWAGENIPKRWFSQSQDYSFLEDNPVQKEIFIIPTYGNDAAGNNNWYGNAGADGTNLGLDHTQAIKNIVDYVIRSTAIFAGDDAEVEGDIDVTITSAEDFFNKKGVYFCGSECVTGLGDLDTAIFVGYDFTDRSFLELIAGIRFPSGKENRCPGRLYYVPTGNNGHFEGRIGIDGGWRSCRWFGIEAELYYTHVFEAVERRAAQFKCATIRGVGPCVEANVKWGYFVGHLDMTVFHPENQKMGFALGYEIFYKRKDQVSFCTCNGNKLLDFLNNVATLDPTLLEVNADILAHKIRGQLYHRWNYFELYAGASKVVGGRNGMSENEVHIGCGINF